jgi:hypothetical protein
MRKPDWYARSRIAASARRPVISRNRTVHHPDYLLHHGLFFLRPMCFWPLRAMLAQRRAKVR